MIRALTSFRFITALVVFLFHCRIHLDWRVGWAPIDSLFLNGAAFMTGFFVLSGFIMCHVYDRTDFTKRNDILLFYLKRFAKIYPMYALATVVYFVAFHDFTPRQVLRSFVNDSVLVQGFFPSMFAVGINGGTWSLTVEAFLYFLFPFLFLLAAKSPKILIVALACAALASFNVRMDQADYIYANPVMRLGDFMCGMGFYFMKDRFRDLKFAAALHVIIVVVLAWACVHSGPSRQYMRTQFAIVPLFGAWITMVFHSRSRLYDNRAGEYLGLISYSFYLWQFAAMELGKKLVKACPDISIHLVVLAALALNVALAALSYHLLEERARRFIVARFGPQLS